MLAVKLVSLAPAGVKEDIAPTLIAILAHKSVASFALASNFLRAKVCPFRLQRVERFPVVCCAIGRTGSRRVNAILACLSAA